MIYFISNYSVWGLLVTPSVFLTALWRSQLNFNKGEMQFLGPTMIKHCHRPKRVLPLLPLLDIAPSTSSAPYSPVYHLMLFLPSRILYSPPHAPFEPW